MTEEYDKKFAQGGYFVCAGCGKRFWVEHTSLWAYKVPLFRRKGHSPRLKLACSWKCMGAVRALQEQRRREDNERLRKRREERKEAEKREH